MVSLDGPKAKRDRSPAYPVIDLGKALARARVLFDLECQNPTPVNVALEHWGQSPKSSGGMRVVAALKQFGLLTEEGSGDYRIVRLSDTALRIVRDERPESPERDELIRAAALGPRIHNHLWEKYEGRLPTDINLLHELRLNRGFNDNAAREFVKQFRATVAFAKLDTNDTGDAYPDFAEDTEIEQMEPVLTQTQPSPPIPPGPSLSTAPEVASAGRAVSIPYSLNKWATLTAEFPLTESEWGQMIAVLNAMKPALVSKTDA